MSWGAGCVQAASACITPQCPAEDCDQSYPTPPGGTCPSQCDQCNNGNTECEIQGDVGNEYIHQTIDCPEGFDCKLVCTGPDSCFDTVVNCPQDGSRQITCSSGWECANMVVNCTFGPCDLSCNYNGQQTCANAVMNCGVEHCNLQCSGTVDIPPTQSCNGSCDCVQSGC